MALGNAGKVGECIRFQSLEPFTLVQVASVTDANADLFLDKKKSRKLPFF